MSWNRDGLREERLLSYPELVAWAVESGTLRGPGPSWMRRGFVRGRPAPKRFLDLERFLSEGFRHLRVTPRGRGYAWSWPAPARDLARPLWPVAWSAARLLASAEAARVRTCANEDCGWLFVDRSRRGNRRWCDMGECGSRDKARRYYWRKKSL